MNRLVLSLGFSLGVCLLAASANSQDAKKPSDAEIVKLLVGKWKMEKLNEVGVNAVTTVNFNKDNTFAYEMKTKSALNGKPDPKGKSIELSSSGTWKVVDGAIELTVMKVKFNVEVKGGKPLPYVEKMPVNSVTESTLKLALTERAKGDPAEEVYNRVKAKK